VDDGVFRAIVDTAISPFGIVDELGTVLWVSTSVEELTGWPAESLVGRNMLDALDEQSQMAVIDSFARFADTASGGGGWLGTGLLVNVVSPTGKTIPCIASSATSTRTGVPGMVIQLTRAAGVTHLHAAVRAMSTGTELTDVLGHLADMVASEIAGAAVEVGWDWDGRTFAHVAGADVKILAADDGDDGDRPWARAIASGDAHTHDRLVTLPPAVAARARELGFIGCWVQPIAVAPSLPPSAAVVVWRSQPVDLTSFTTHYVQRGVDMVSLALRWDRGLRALEREANHDALTGLANRRAFFDRLRATAAPDVPGTVLFCDLDRFKPINDVHGHTVGDRVLVVVGERLRSAVRPSDLVARYGGDEFVVFCPALVAEGEVAALTERLRRVVSLPITFDGLTVEVGMSVGAERLHSVSELDRVMSAASGAMTAAKPQCR
jgi:diguanylate cyclase (GGDEF)-like protein/PAS domain S-box-containing protein